MSDDPTGTGKERIAAALRAVAQDPLFAALQVRRDQAYTERGAKKTARGSVFKDAADRVNETRNEKERLQKLVDDSESVEKELRKLMAKSAASPVWVGLAATTSFGASTILGSRIVKVEPRPGSLSTVMSPPII